MLNHIRVVEIATYVAAPSAGAILADWGAEVVKVEPPSGCPMREAFATEAGYSPVFDLDNRGKQAIALDLTQAKSTEIVKKLLANADVLLTNMRGKSLERMGISYDQLKREFPRLIYASVSGYGTVGPDKDLPSFDISAFFARSGMIAASTPKQTEPAYPRTAVGDHVSGIATAAAILAAILSRQKTDKGCFIDSSLLRAGLYALGADIVVQLGFGRLGSTKPRHEARNPIANFFKTKDDRWLILMPRPLKEAEWQKLCKAVGAEDMARHPDYDTPKKRRAAAADIVDRLDHCFAKHTLAEWSALLDEIDFIWAPLLTPKEVIEDPQAKAMESFVEIPDKASGTRSSLANPIRFVDADCPPLGSVPEIGEDTESILSDLGYSDDDMTQMKKSGLFG